MIRTWLRSPFPPLLLFQPHRQQILQHICIDRYTILSAQAPPTVDWKVETENQSFLMHTKTKEFSTVDELKAQTHRANKVIEKDKKGKHRPSVRLRQRRQTRKSTRSLRAKNWRTSANPVLQLQMHPDWNKLSMSQCSTKHFHILRMKKQTLTGHSREDLHNRHRWFHQSLIL